VANQQQKPLFDAEDFQETFRKAFPYISDEYWSIFSKMGDFHRFIDWNEYGKHVKNQTWSGIGNNEEKEFFYNYIQKAMTNIFNDRM
jgi:hypothetical protein